MMSGHSITRRAALAGLGGLAAGGFGGSAARAAGTTLNVLSHEAMKGAASTGAGGDVLAAWKKANDCDVNWITLDVEAIGIRLQREASLHDTSIDVGYVKEAVPSIISMMEPIAPFMAKAPIEGVDAGMSDYSPSLIQSLTSGGTLRGVPVRISAQGMLYNEALFEERGITTLPKTMEELIDVARKLTFTRPDGSKVYGLLFVGASSLTDGWAAFARSYGGDYMTADMKLHANESGTVRSLEMLAGLYKDRVLPSEMFSVTAEELLSWMQQGRVAITVNVLARLPSLNDPKRSKFPSKIKAMDWPMTSALAGKVPHAASLDSWALVMPKNSAAARKQLAWSFIQELSSKAGTAGQALNGNGPARISTYADPRFASVPFMAAMGPALKYGRITLPPFANETKVSDIFVEEAQTVVLGRKTAQQAMDEAVARVKPLV